MAEWERAADINFIHLEQYDDWDTPDIVGGNGTCNPDTNDEIFFRIGLQNVLRGVYGATGFLGAGADPQDRYLWINSQTLGTPSLLHGTLLHELGHVLGFDHEHGTFPGSQPGCDAALSARQVTPVDPSSIMFYDWCKGHIASPELLSIYDRFGVAAVYHLPHGGGVQSFNSDGITDILWYLPDEQAHVLWYSTNNPALPFDMTAVCRYSALATLLVLGAAGVQALADEERQRAARMLLVLLTAQIALGSLTVLSGFSLWLAISHHLAAAALLATVATLLRR